VPMTSHATTGLLAPAGLVAVCGERSYALLACQTASAELYVHVLITKTDIRKLKPSSAGLRSPLASSWLN